MRFKFSDYVNYPLSKVRELCRSSFKEIGSKFDRLFEAKSVEQLAWDQGYQIGRIFARWSGVYFGNYLDNWPRS
jgi:hypothetical protein